MSRRAPNLDALERVIPALEDWAASLHPTPGRELLKITLPTMLGLITELRSARAAALELALSVAELVRDQPDAWGMTDDDWEREFASDHKAGRVTTDKGK